MPNDRIQAFEAVKASRFHLIELIEEAIGKWKNENDFTAYEQNTIVTSILSNLAMEYFFHRTSNRARVDAWEAYKGVLQDIFEERMEVYENY
jgi:hypothetical protein